MVRSGLVLALVALGTAAGCTRQPATSAATTVPITPPTSVTEATAATVVTTSTPIATPATTGTTTSTTPTTPTTSTSTSSTTTTSVPQLTAVGSALTVGEDATMPITLNLPTAPDRPQFDDVIAAWVAVHRAVFVPRARSALNARAAAAARAAAEAASAATSTTVPGATTTTSTTTTTVPLPPPQWTVDHGPVRRTGAASLVRLQSTMLLDAVPETTTEVFYAFDTGPVLPALALIEPTSVDRLLDVVRHQLGDRAGDWAGLTAPDLLTDMTLDGDELHVVLPSRALAAGAPTDPVVVDAATTNELLSPVGRALLTGGPVAPPERDVDCAAVACVALTFDDGPSEHTDRLLDVLRRADVPATFFVLGQGAERRPDVLARMVADGHTVGNHSWSHRDFTTLSAEAQLDEVSRASAAIAGATGVLPSLFRPPYGRRDRDTLYLGYGVALWDVDSRDWEHRNPARTLANVLTEVRDGSVVLLHDLHGSTVDTVALLVVELRAAGFHLVTLDRLLGTVEPGAVYRSESDREPPPPPTTTTSTTTTTTTVPE